MMLRKPNCSDCPHNLQYMESLPIKKKGVTMHLGECFCVAGKRARKFKRSDPKTYVPSWCPRLKAPCELRIYGFKNQREWRMHRSRGAFYMETSILSAYSKNECQKYFDYLEQLRQSGETNMYGAVPYLQEEFPELRYSPERARKILLAWFGTFREKEADTKC